MSHTYTLGEPLDADVVAYAEEHCFSDLLGVEIPTQKVQYSANYGVSPTLKTPYLPELPDLVRLHRTIRQRRVFTVLEFGVGYSSVVMADALARNEAAFGDDFRNSNRLRRNNPFELHSVDSSEEYLGLVRDRIPQALSGHIHLHHSTCTMGVFNGRVCHYYDNLPNVSPDFIYLDAPAQFDVYGDIRGISTHHQDRMPMAADLAAMEHFLQPGTLILVDGRTANARFLRSSFQRAWTYNHDLASDVHWFELLEAPLGVYNDAAIRFSLGEDYFVRLANRG